MGPVFLFETIVLVVDATAVALLVYVVREQTAFGLLRSSFFSRSSDN